MRRSSWGGHSWGGVVGEVTHEEMINEELCETGILLSYLIPLSHCKFWNIGNIRGINNDDPRLYCYTPIVRWVVLCYAAVRLSVCLSEDNPFPWDNSKSFTAISLKPDIYLSHWPPRNPIRFRVVTLMFKVTEVTKVKFGFQSITPKVLELPT